MIEISVIIPTYNRKYLLGKLIDSLYNCNFNKQFYEIIVVDDGSSDGTADMLKRLQSSYSNLFYKGIKNSGPGISRNIGVELSRGRIVAFLDDDCLVDKSWFVEIRECLLKNNGPDFVFGKILPYLPFDYPFFHTWDFHGQHITTCNAAMKKGIFIEIGGFDPVLSYWAEDCDFVARLKRSGGEIIYNPNMIVTHVTKYIGFHLRDYIYTSKFWKQHDYLFSKNPDLSHKSFHIDLLRRNTKKIIIFFTVLLLAAILNNVLILLPLFLVIFLRNYLRVQNIIIKGKDKNLSIKPSDSFKYIFFSWLVDPVNLILFLRHRLSLLLK